LISDTPANANFATDGIINSVYSSKNTQCYIGFDFGSNSFANVSSIKYMPNPAWPIAANMLEGAKFEGSNDSSTWTTIFTYRHFQSSFRMELLGSIISYSISIRKIFSYKYLWLSIIGLSF
jgi:hypothetical protein